MGEPADPVVIGTVAAPHGVRGTVRVKATGSGRHLRKGVAPIVNGARRPILTARETPKGFLVDFEGVENRGAAAGLRGVELLLDRGELDPPDEDEFYVGDLVGLVAHDETGTVLGVVAETFATPAHEVLVVRGGEGDAEYYVPFIQEHVSEVDAAGGRIVVRPPEWEE